METSAQPEMRSLDGPDETRPAGVGEGKIINLRGLTFLHLTLQPGGNGRRTSSRSHSPGN
jgi:hypothetical protein